MEVLPHDAPHRLLVLSGDKKYLTDLDAMGGNGRCNCQHFQIHLQGSVVSGGAHQCKHLQKANFIARGIGHDPDPVSPPTILVPST